MTEVTPVDVLSAAKRIRPFIDRTPFEESRPLSERSGARVFLKMENLQRTGSFKARGAFSFVTAMSDDARAKGVLAVSSGNHAQGVAWAAGEFGLDAVIVMPENTPATKIEATRRYGARVVLAGGNFDEADRIATEMAAESGRTFVSAFADRHVIAGQGTIGLEMMLARPDLDAIIVPTGGGGALCGIACVAKALNPRIRVYGVQSEASCPWYHSFREGRPVEAKVFDSLAEGLSNAAVPEYMFNMGKRWVDGILTVTEEEIAGAMFWMMREHHMIIEGSAAVSVAVLLSHRLRLEGKTAGALLTGGNVDVARVKMIAASEGRLSA
ncbi:MAG: threonine ammonia-lyase [Ignavibacteriales bacterium]